LNNKHSTHEHKGEDKEAKGREGELDKAGLQGHDSARTYLEIHGCHEEAD